MALDEEFRWPEKRDADLEDHPAGIHVGLRHRGARPALDKELLGRRGALKRATSAHLAEYRLGLRTEQCPERGIVRVVRGHGIAPADEIHSDPIQCALDRNETKGTFVCTQGRRTGLPGSPPAMRPSRKM